MPSIREIPGRIEKICAPCEYHKRINAFYGKDYSWVDYCCMHPNAFEPIPPSDSPVKERLRIKLEEYHKENGRYIGRTELCPNFCPLNCEVVKTK